MTGNNKQILVLNAGSSSLKLGLFEASTLDELTEENVAWGQATQNGVNGHRQALEHLLAKIKLDRSKLAAVGHRVVHGGDHYQETVQINDRVKQSIGELARLAPLHNKIALEVIEASQELLPGVAQFAAFDTAFHATLAPAAFLYPVPYEWYEKWGVRRFGFHGLSYTYSTGRAAQLLNRPVEGLRLVACHLGSGCSLAAIEGGRSVATTMGFTPLEGLMMSSRSGSVDPGLLLYLLEHAYLSREALDEALNHESGLKGIYPPSAGDMRRVITDKANEERAVLAFEMYVSRVCQGIGAMTAALGGLDALVFAGGVGEHSGPVRAAVSERLAWLGINLDKAANDSITSDGNIADSSSRISVLVIHTREELVIAREVQRLITQNQTVS